MSQTRPAQETNGTTSRQAAASASSQCALRFVKSFFMKFHSGVGKPVIIFCRDAESWTRYPEDRLSC